MTLGRVHRFDPPLLIRPNDTVTLTVLESHATQALGWAPAPAQTSVPVSLGYYVIFDGEI